ncbi:D-inositol-3-phosphate glycosyltransferase [Cellulomonas carbonis]|uniref:D-inositol-3-phosphate glycosyltransferase n=1 Tax=Cellulomonas carbonis T26 TaxID=947969 RepID=A0A0A0BTA1_9CELL|nr:D-inositol-3-phosphate glycosyltransferase [Cellulomonas carbonis]KGM11156.1 diguanylate cyclase [Cellulomonas carbonis T26]GGC05065.1 D-inositol 3-phosphate glycosyltransferase [Cellulomonas carbonis]
MSLDQPRVAMLSVHTSPLDQPGTGDAGGMNVYVTDLARALAARGAQVEIFTRATTSRLPETVPMDDGVLVRHVPAGPYEGLDKNDLPGQLCAFTAGVLRTGAARARGWYDVVHSHYWLSGQVGWLAADRWDVPLIHTMHTLAKVKNAALAPGDRPEPVGRVIGEEQVVAAAHALVASTAEEAGDLVELYDADPGAVHVVAPGVDLDLFHADVPAGPVDAGALADAQLRARLAVGLPLDEQVVLFAGRVQPLKAPDVLVRALGEIARRGRPVPLLVVLGGPSGNPRAVAELTELARSLGVASRVVVRPPVGRRELGAWYRAADLVAVPSRSESFGLVAAEAQACGTPVVAAAVGGLRTVVVDGVTGALVRGHRAPAWADALTGLLGDAPTRSRLALGALRHGRRLGWEAAAEAMVKVYDLAHDRVRRGAA